MRTHGPREPRRAGGRSNPSSRLSALLAAFVVAWAGSSATLKTAGIMHAGGDR
jgi:hypothetical protein